MKKIKQCKSKYWKQKDGRCQGASGHKGCHWHYDLHGSLLQWGYPRKSRIGSSWIPPGHEHYISPEKKMEEYWLALEIQQRDTTAEEK